MMTIENIHNNFSFISALTGSTETYHDTLVFEGKGNFCDIYFRSKDKKITQQQVDIFNNFRENYPNFISEIEKFIITNLSNSEKSKQEEIGEIQLMFDVIEIPQNNSKYDLVLVCGKTYKSFLFFKTNINIRVEFQNGQKINQTNKR